MILLDINMAQMGRFEFLQTCEHLHASQRPRAVVAMLTPPHDPRDMQCACRFGCVKRDVVKPLDVGQARVIAGVVWNLPPVKSPGR